jgi:hypothetical protein
MLYSISSSSKGICKKRYARSTCICAKEFHGCYEKKFIIKYPAAGCTVTLFIFDDITKNVQIAVSSLLQSIVRKPELMFIIKTE